MLISFVISLLILLFIYPLIIYPFILFVLDKLIGKEPLKNISFQPEITVLIAAYNEEAMIKDAVNSVLNSNYPKDKIKIIVGSDGSSDRTCEIVQYMMKDYPQLELLEFGRMGKNKVMNHLFAAAKSDFIYVLDADLRFAPDTISNSISLMTDEEIGCVMMNIKSISEAELMNHNSGGMGEGFYHRFEQYFREKESRIKTTVNVIGTYLIRKNAQVPLPNSAVCDDLYTVLQVSVNGKRAVFSKESLVYDIRPKQSGEEMKRRARMAAGQLAVCAAIPSLFNPFKGWVSLFFISHKFIRYNYCWLMIGIAVLTFFLLAENQIYFYLLSISQILFYLFALLGYILDKKGITKKVFSLPYFFLLINLGWLLGYFKYFSGNASSTWERIDT